MKYLGEEERLSYGRTLLGMVARRSQRPGDLLTCSTTMAEGKKPIQQRIQLLVKRPETKGAALFLAVCVIALSLVFVFSTQNNPRQMDFTSYEQFLSEFDMTRYWQLSGNSRNAWVATTADLSEASQSELKQLISTGTPEHRWVNRTDYGRNNAHVSFSNFPTQLFLYETETGCHLVEGLSFEGDMLDSFLHYRQIKYQYFHLATFPSGTVQAVEKLLDSSTLTPLTQEELDFFNSSGFFDDGTRIPGEPGFMNIRNQFLSSFYDDPRNIDLFDLFYCGTGQNNRSIEEIQQIEKAIIDSGVYSPECGCTTLTTADMDEVLTQHMGLTLEETNKVGLEHMDYLPSHDVYYHFHGDTNYAPAHHFTSGQRLGNTIELYYQDTFGLLGFVPCVLTLQQEGDHYYFYSNQPRYDDPAITLSVPNTGDPSIDTQTFADELRTRYIFLNKHHPRAVHEARFYRLEELSRSDTQMWIRLSLAIDPVIQDIYAWNTQRGLLPIKTGPHAGLYDFTLDYQLELQENNTWLCTKAVTGGPFAS